MQIFVLSVKLSVVLYIFVPVVCADLCAECDVQNFVLRVMSCADLYAECDVQNFRLRLMCCQIFVPDVLCGSLC